MRNKLSHTDSSGKAKMVDVGGKKETDRIALAHAEIKMTSETLTLIKHNEIKKGDVLTVAQLAGIMAAKKTSDIIPLCHPLQLTHVEVSCHVDDELPGISISASVRTYGRTGVEMEALTAATVAALTVYDMVKASEKSMVIQNIHLVEKRGGKSGIFYSNINSE